MKQTSNHSKIRVGIICGGRSAEHQISLLSAKSVIAAMDPHKYEVVLLGIHPSGEWFLYDRLETALLNVDNPERISLNMDVYASSKMPASVGSNAYGEAQGSTFAHPVALTARGMENPLVALNGSATGRPLDVIFPVLHGPYGEDGTIQGLLKLANIPFVGAGVLASAVAMDKDVSKRLLRDADLPIAPFLVLHQHQKMDFDSIVAALGLPFFVKPANLGSSVGVSKIYGRDDFDQKMALAFSFDRKILVEAFIEGREIECSVLGNEDPIASIAGEIIPQHDFYSYEAKYLDDQGALLEIPAQISEEQMQRVRAIACEAYQVLCCEGMARVDLFLKKNGDILINEINTIPGFTKISMYPKLWAATGIAYPDLIDRLIHLAINRFQQEQLLQTQLQLLEV